MLNRLPFDEPARRVDAIGTRATMDASLDRDALSMTASAGRLQRPP